MTATSRAPSLSTTQQTADQQAGAAARTSSHPLQSVVLDAHTVVFERVLRFHPEPQMPRRPNRSERMAPTTGLPLLLADEAR